MAGNTDDYDYGDMLRDQGELDAATEPEWLVLAQDALTPSQFKRFNIAEVKRIAGKNGGVVSVTEEKNKRGEVVSYTVSVERVNPRYKGGRKGAGKRKFMK